MVKEAKMKRLRKCGERKVRKVMREFKAGSLKSGRSNKTVTARKQAVAIGLSEARRKCGPKSVGKRDPKMSPSEKRGARKQLRSRAGLRNQNLDVGFEENLFAKSEREAEAADKRRKRALARREFAGKTLGRVRGNVTAVGGKSIFHEPMVRARGGRRTIN